MNKEKLFKGYFWVIGVYDILLGSVFALYFKEIYQYLGITLPNHPGYIYVPAFFLISGGLGEFLIARNPLRNIDLVIVRMSMKASFAGAVFYCYFRYGVPEIFLIISLLSIIGVLKNVYFLRWARSAAVKEKTS